MKALKLVHTCEINRCPVGCDPDVFDCMDVCEHCKLCTSDGMVVTKVKANNVVYEVVHATCDEIILLTPWKDLLSIRPDLKELSKYVEIAETKYDHRRANDYD